MTAVIHALPRSTRPIQDSHAVLTRLITIAFELAADHDDDDRLAEDLVSRLSLEIMVWAERHGIR